MPVLKSSEVCLLCRSSGAWSVLIEEPHGKENPARSPFFQDSPESDVVLWIRSPAFACGAGMTGGLVSRAVN